MSADPSTGQTPARVAPDPAGRAPRGQTPKRARSSSGRRLPPWGSALARIPAWAITAAASVAYLIAAPASPDLAAADYRSHLFSQVGFSLWDNSWYGGHHLPAYSVLAPGLGALIGPQPLAAISMIVATALFTVAIAGRFPDRAVRIASIWFAVGASIALLSSRVPFNLGLALGLGTVVLAQRRRWLPAALLAVLASLASPVAGAFLALAMLSWALSGPDRAWPAALTLLALAPIAILTLAFPEGGTQPFVASAFFPALAGVAVIGLVIAPEHRALRIGALLYLLALIGAYAIPTAVGGNADRLGALAAGPLAACVLAGTETSWRTKLLLVLAPLLLYWQANAPVADFASTVSNRSVRASFYTPLLGELHTLGIGYGRRPARIEVVATADHWEARWVAPAAMMARGWERQLDGFRNGLFYDERPLTPARYSAWLGAQAISYVALPDAPLDYSGKAEARVVAGSAANGPGGFLREVWHSAHWRLFAVRRPAPLAQPPARLTAADTQSFTLQAPAPGSYEVRLHYTPYWAVARGDACVAQAPGEWTLVQARRPGTVHVVIRFSIGRIFEHGVRCP
ncbi:MAG: hypothetical protein ACLQBB_01775 [Solirubrobacteraceae bacterium]